MVFLDAYRIDYTSLRDALLEVSRSRRISYKAIALEVDMPFPRILRLMNGGEANLTSVDVVNLCRYSGLPLDEVVEGGGEDDS